MARSLFFFVAPLVGIALAGVLGFAAGHDHAGLRLRGPSAFATMPSVRVVTPSPALLGTSSEAYSSRGAAGGEGGRTVGALHFMGAAACCWLVHCSRSLLTRARPAASRRVGRLASVGMAAVPAPARESVGMSATPAAIGDARTVVDEERLVTNVNPLDGPSGTYQVGIDFKGWLQSSQEEIDVSDLRVEGKIPAWLRGTLVHAGPAKFEFGDDEFVDWVDGQAMLYRLRIRGDDKCEYRNRWLNTWNHRSHRAAGRIAVRETCSRPSLPAFWDRLAYMFNPPNNENGNLHISQMAGGSRCVSMSVGSALLEFTLRDMETLGKVPFTDEMSDGGPLIFHAEPHVDTVTGEWFTCAIQLKIEGLGLTPEYVVYSVTPDQPREPGAPLRRRLITRIQTDYPSPVHTISLTPKYIVMIQIPYPLNWDGMLNAEGKWLLTGNYEGNLNDYNTWQPERPTLIRLIDRVTGEHTAVFETHPFFFFHTINSFEEDICVGVDSTEHMVYLDVVCYDEPPVGFPLRQARSGDVEDWRGGGGEVRRLELNVSTGSCEWTGWPDNCFDEPKINPKVDGVRHKYSWGVIDDHGVLRLTKQDHDTHEVVKWEEQDPSRELPWQPVFVPEPYNDREDAGVLMSFVRDQPTGDTFCVVLDGETMKEQARIHFPKGHHVPLHGHGTWMMGQY